MSFLFVPAADAAMSSLGNGKPLTRFGHPAKPVQEISVTASITNYAFLIPNYLLNRCSI